MLAKLQILYPGRISAPKSLSDIPKNYYVVYILTFNGSPVVLGHGKINRAKVIFDDEKQITSGHIKAIFVRLYNLYGNGVLDRYIIVCQDKKEAGDIERNLHQQIGGNTRHIPDEIRNQLFFGLDTNSNSNLLLEIALCSSFDGLSDLRKWRSAGLLNDNIWKEISHRLKLI